MTSWHMYTMVCYRQGCMYSKQGKLPQLPTAFQQATKASQLQFTAAADTSCQLQPRTPRAHTARSATSCSGCEKAAIQGAQSSVQLTEFCVYKQLQVQLYQVQPVAESGLVGTMHGCSSSSACYFITASSRHSISAQVTTMQSSQGAPATQHPTACTRAPARGGTSSATTPASHVCQDSSPT